MSTTYYQVDHYQLNAAVNSAGDSAILLLVEKTNPPGANKGTVTSAVVIDGGKGQEVGKLLMKVINRIQTDYTIPPGAAGSILKFDAIIVTHWDVDHYAGIKWWLEQPQYWDDNPNMFRYFKYKLETVEVDGEDQEVATPETRLYCQEEWPEAKLPKGPYFDENDTKEAFVPEDHLDVQHGEDIIGINAFTGLSLKEGITWEDVETLAELIEANDPEETDGPDMPGAPGLFIVGVLETFLGNTEEIAASSGFGDIFSPPQPVVPKDEGFGVIDADLAGGYNPESVVMLLVWKPKTAGGSPKVSLYTGGDAEYPMENKAAAFVDGEQIQVYKGGHHGSRAGTSSKFIEAVKPNHFIYSNGIEHGHPRPEVLLYLDAWMTLNPAVDGLGNDILKRLHTVVYPYHLGQVWDGGHLRPFSNHFVDPDRLTTIYKSLVVEVEADKAYTMDQLMANFVDWHNKQSYIIDPTTQPPNNTNFSLLDQFTTQVTNYINDTTRTIPDPAKNDPEDQEMLEEYEEECKQFTTNKAAYLCPLLTPRFNSWSNSTWQHYAVKAFEVSRAPACIINLDYLLLEYTYDKDGANDFLLANVNQVREGAISNGTLAFGTAEIKIKAAKIDADEESGGEEEKEELKANVQAPQSSLSAKVQVRGTKRKAVDEPRGPMAPPDGVLSVDDEAYVISIENELGDQIVPESPVWIVPEVELEYEVPDIDLITPAAPEVESLLGVTPSLPQMIYPSYGATSDTIINPPDGSNRDYFVVHLRSGCLKLTGSQAKISASGWSATLDPKDVLQRWLKAFFVSPIGGVSISLMGSADSVWDEEWSLVIPMPSGKTTMPVTYNSRFGSIETMFGVSQDVSTIIDTTGFFNQSVGVLFALEMGVTKGVSFTLGQLYTMLETPKPFFLDDSVVLNLVIPSAGTSQVLNGVWISPADNMSVTWKMTLAGSTSTAYLLPLLEIPGFKFLQSTIVATKTGFHRRSVVKGTTTQNSMATCGDICIRASTQFHTTDAKLAAFTWDTYLTLSPSAVSLFLRFSGTGTSIMDNLITWLSGPTMLNVSLGSLWSQFANTLKSIDIHVRELYVNAQYVNSSWQFSSFSVTLELNVQWTPKANVPVKLKFTYQKGNTPYFSFDGSFWTPISNDLMAILPSSPPYPFLNPSVEAQDYFLLTDLLSDAQKQAFPSHVIPTAVTRLQMSINTDSISFVGSIKIDPSLPPDPSPSWLVLNTVSIDAKRMNADGSLAFSFAAQMFLNPRSGLKTYSSTLELDILYSTKSGWTFHGSVWDLNLGCLYSLFPGTENDAVMNVMSDITISSLDVTFKVSNAAGADFDITGVILLGNMELDLAFHRTSATGANNVTTTNWSFAADLSLGSISTGTNVGTVIQDISNDLATITPDFIKKIGFAIPKGSSMSLRCLKTTEPDTPSIILSLVVKVSGFEFAFVQLSPVAAAAKSRASAPKRLFRFTMDAFPDIENVPLLDQLTQPFDQMDFFWASDNLTRQEVSDLNTYVFNAPPTGNKKVVDRLFFKEPQTTDKKIIQTPGTQSPGDVVVMQGCHFQIITEQNNVPTPVLDYTFAGQPTPPTTKNVNSGNGGGGGIMAAPASDPQATGNGTAIDKWTKTVGPLTISSIGLKFENSTLWIMLDASIKLGPIAGDVQGFGIGIPLNSDLHSIDTRRSIQVVFSGIGVELKRPPVELAGTLIKTAKGFEGGVTIQVEPYTFVAAGGYYDQVQDPTTKALFKSIFVFAELDGPIAEFEFASLSGLTGGVGYNSKVNLPTIDKVTDFPFINTADRKNSDPLSILGQYLSENWFTPADGPAWVAGGITVNAFSSLVIKTVVMVDLSADIVFGIFADIQADFPAGATADAEKIASIEMGMLAIVDPAKGIFHAEGQLTPRSYILSKDCHLTGGFALCYWFEGSGHEGDWVFTIGGYHSQFLPPTWYPTPPRLAINWKFDDTISIHGDAFFAITPKVCMGGGDIKVTFESGSLSAYFDAYADFLINYRPFSYIARVGVNVGVRYTLDCYFVTKHFDVHFGCNLTLNGPPLAGVVHIDWCIISFDIHFGNAQANTQKLTWTQFCALIRQQPENAPLATKDVVTGQGMHTITATSGVIGIAPTAATVASAKTAGNDPSQQAMIQSDNGSQVLLVNKTAFGFTFTSLFPITSVTNADGDQIPNTNETVSDVYIKPMQLTSTVTSNVKVEITSSSGSPAVQGGDGKFLWKPSYKQAPTALWGQYSSASDPNIGASSSTAYTSLLNTTGSTQNQMMGLEFTAAEPTSSNDAINLNVELGSSYPVGTTPLPGPLSTPAAVLSSQDLDAAINFSAPMTPATPYPPRTILGRIANPNLPPSTLLTSWMKWNGLTTDTPFGSRLADLGAQTAGGTPLWLNELLNAPTSPLPVLTAEASVKALMRDGTRFASWGGYRGTGAVLGRDWVDGGVPLGGF